MSEETTELILGDAAVDATAHGRRGLRRQRQQEREEHVLTHCENCGAPLTGPYCGQCGQHAIDYRRSLWRVLIDAADSFFNWDTKFLSSLGVLLTRPWKLTNDFNAGRRARYVHPLRLYLLASIAFFLVVKVVNLNGGHFELRPEDRAEIDSALSKLAGPDSVLTPEQRAKVESARAKLAEGNGAMPEEQRVELQKMVADALASNMKEKFARGERSRLRAALSRVPEPTAPPTPLETTPDSSATPAEAASPFQPPLSSIPPFAIPPTKGMKGDVHFGRDGHEANTPFEAWMQSRIKDKVGQDGTKATLFLETLRSNIPTMMLCCIPLFALVLKMLYLGKRRYYVEHLVYALHIHTFAYIGATLITLIALGLARWSETARAIVVAALSVVMFVQVFLSIRRVYGQGWFFTTFKFLLGGFVYFVIIVCAVAVTAFVTLLLPG
ncbi:MAG: DUF3667 domain-containing protein [Verrucomicrobiota bacterium]|nr:DUF3667 domain-containing protein [Verrucomicrobiota bacterium]